MLKSTVYLPRKHSVWEWATGERQAYPGGDVVIGTSDTVRKKKATTPPAPSWLAQFVPSQAAGRPITKARIPTPSGQQLATMPWSQEMQLAGYAEWAGGRSWADILRHAAMMQPEAVRGGTTKRYAPAGQWA